MTTTTFIAHSTPTIDSDWLNDLDFLRYDSQDANKFWASPSAAAGAPSFRTITAADITTALTALNVPQIIASGTLALATTEIASAAASSAQTASASGVLTTDTIIATFNADITGVTGYVPSTSGMLTIISYPTTDTVNFKVINMPVFLMVHLKFMRFFIVFSWIGGQFRRTFKAQKISFQIDGK